MHIELIIIWDDGEKNIYEYPTTKEACAAGDNMKKVFGHQISWIGVRKRHT